MASSDAARKAWETRRQKALAAGKPLPGPSAPKRQRPKEPTTPQERLQAEREADAILTRCPIETAPTAKPAKPKPENPEPKRVGNYLIDTSAYVQRHRHEPSGEKRWTYVVTGRHRLYESCTKVTDITCSAVSFEAMLAEAQKVAWAHDIPAGTIRVMP